MEKGTIPGKKFLCTYICSIFYLPTVDDDDDVGHDPLYSNAHTSSVDELNDGGGYDEAAMKESQLFSFGNHQAVGADY